MYFYASNPGAPRVRPFWTLEPWFEQNKLGKRPQAMLQTKFQTSEASGSEEEDF